jgi:hypothetical protein
MSQKELFYQWNAAMSDPQHWPEFIQNDVLPRRFDVSTQPHTFVISRHDDPDFGTYYINAPWMDYSPDLKDYVPVFTITSSRSSQGVDVRGVEALRKWWFDVLMGYAMTEVAHQLF